VAEGWRSVVGQFGLHASEKFRKYIVFSLSGSKGHVSGESSFIHLNYFRFGDNTERNKKVQVFGFAISLTQIMGGVTSPIERIERLPLRLGDGDAGTESMLHVVKLAFVCSRVNEGSP
jgi:hypothetical protein